MGWFGPSGTGFRFESGWSGPPSLCIVCVPWWSRPPADASCHAERVPASCSELCPYRLREGPAAVGAREEEAMQARTFTSLHLIHLPRLDAMGAQTLARSMLAAAEEHPALPEPVRETRDEVAAA